MCSALLKQIHKNGRQLSVVELNSLLKKKKEAGDCVCSILSVTVTHHCVSRTERVRKRGKIYINIQERLFKTEGHLTF